MVLCGGMPLCDTVCGGVALCAIVLYCMWCCYTVYVGCCGTVCVAVCHAVALYVVV